MKEREPERNESTDDSVWQDLVARLENMPADETHGGRDVPGGTGDEGSRIKAADPGTVAGPPSGASAVPPADGRGEDGRGEDGNRPGTGVPPEQDPEATPHNPASSSAAERTRAIFENQPFRAGSPRGPRDYDEPEELESEGEFVPPEPPPFSTGEPLVVLAWIGALGGPLLLLLFAMFWRGAPVPVILGVIALFGAAAAYLLFRLPQHHDDDGAAV